MVPAKVYMHNEERSNINLQVVEKGRNNYELGCNDECNIKANFELHPDVVIKHFLLAL
jgi:hypothetical protein